MAPRRSRVAGRNNRWGISGDLRRGTRIASMAPLIKGPRVFKTRSLRAATGREAIGDPQRLQCRIRGREPWHIGSDEPLWLPSIAPTGRRNNLRPWFRAQGALPTPSLWPALCKGSPRGIEAEGHQESSSIRAFQGSARPQMIPSHRSFFAQRCPRFRWVAALACRFSSVLHVGLHPSQGHRPRKLFHPHANLARAFVELRPKIIARKATDTARAPCWPRAACKLGAAHNLGQSPLQVTPPLLEEVTTKPWAALLPPASVCSRPGRVTRKISSIEGGEVWSCRPSSRYAGGRREGGVRRVTE